ncbi:putative F-box and FNIP repeat-containing protein [Cotonvirus japonicus]|uniref:F-box and FNIP repeat-containing protein n=1 Tax=Cotonvirus japonicus TaxID=2811091 RepID=A0ABM7NR41_9VIRU|nr:putative F-box and FNIP repeat-containing protein [Cotonvirus japonicus]BCS82620.1 putative F-box and FNIP repeat-containing protein [Cotonvirus japonicus]
MTLTDSSISIIEFLNDDTLMHIINYLEDHNKMSFMRTCSQLYEFRSKIYYDDLYYIKNIEHLGFKNKLKIIYVNKFKISNNSVKTNQKIFYTITNDRDIIPKNTTHLIIGKRFNFPKKINPPESVTHLTFGFYYNKPILDLFPDKKIPSTIKHITFGYCFDQPIENKNILDGVTNIIFGNNFNQPIESCLPESLTHLTFGYSFNQCIKQGDIPSSVTHLTFGSRFNQPIKSYLPSSIISLTFGDDFNQYINQGDIPPNVKYLTFGWDFNQPIVDVIPDSVKYLTLGNDFSQDIIGNRNIIPENVTHLIIREKYKNDCKFLPKKVRNFVFTPYWNLIND